MVGGEEGIPKIINALPTPRRSNMRTMHLRAYGHHVLMHHPTQQRILPQLITLPETDFLLIGEGRQTRLLTLILLVGAHTIGRVGLADALGEVFDYVGGAEGGAGRSFGSRVGGRRGG